MTIPLSLAVILYRRKDVPFGLVAWSFVLFIAACGFTHFMAIWTLWNPDYGAEALLKAATAIVSVFTAVLLWTLVPFVVSLPSPASLQQANADLEQMVLERDRALISLRQETQQRAKAEDALRQAQKIEAVGELTGGVAHDFNNLLTVIIGGLDMICRNPGGDPARVARAADMALQGAQRAAGLTARLLAFARRQPLNPTRLRVDTVVTDLAELLHRTLGEHIELKTVVSRDIWTIEADQNQLESALVNLAVNARDAMPTGGKLTIEIENVVLDEPYVETNADAIPGEYVVLAVSDSGEGMSKATSSRVFEPFFTTKAAGKGTGLGLSMVYGFVKQSGGHVTIYSEVGFGTTVKLYFPRSHGDVERVEFISDPDVSPGRPDEVILVVEDNEGVRRFSTEALRDLGYQVLEAADADAALSVLQSPAEIALLFTDVVLPGRSGRDLADLTKSIRPDLPILFTSGYARNAIVHEGRLDAGIQLLGKPFTKDQLAARIRGVLNGAKGGGSS